LAAGSMAAALADGDGDGAIVEADGAAAGAEERFADSTHSIHRRAGDPVRDAIGPA